MSVVARTGGDLLCTSSESDPRMTSVGRFLRKFSIDEWPQLWNVISRLLQPASGYRRGPSIAIVTELLSDNSPSLPPIRRRTGTASPNGTPAGTWTRMS